MSNDSKPGQTGEQRAAAMMTDEFLLRAYQRAEDAPGDPEADALSAEIWLRNLTL